MFEGRKCVGVTYRRGNQKEKIRASKEIVLCGGAYNSPHLLQVSGIGPASHLKEIGVDVLHDLPGVGSNLADHWGARMKHRVRKSEITMNQLSRFPRVITEVGKYVLFGNGALTFGVTSAMVFCRSREGLSSPDLQLTFTPATPIDTGQGALEREPGVQLTAIPVRPESRGHVMSGSSDPFSDPVISPAYLTDDNDINVVVSGIKICRRIFEAPALKEVSLSLIHI